MRTKRCDGSSLVMRLTPNHSFYSMTGIRAFAFSVGGLADVASSYSVQLTF